MLSRRLVLLGLVSLGVTACAEGALQGGHAADERFYAQYCQKLGHTDASAEYNKCVSDKRHEIETERSRRVRPDVF